MKKELLVKTLALGIVVLFFITAVSSTIGISNNLDDTTPPITTVSFDPPEPDGENGWYVSIVTVTLNATDDDSGVNTTYYRVDGVIWYNYTEPFILDFDGENILIEFYSVDNAGNQEEVKSVKINIDKTKPVICLEYEITGGDPVNGWELTFTAIAIDDTSGMNRVEFYNKDGLQKTVYEVGPTYTWETTIDIDYLVCGFIVNRKITDEYVKFFAIVVSTRELNYGSYYKAYAYDNAGNSDYGMIPDGPPPYYSTVFFKKFTFINDYEGYIGRFFIKATFEFIPIEGVDSK